MSRLDDFKLYSENKPLFITIRKGTITFSKSAIEALNYSEYVRLYINDKTKEIAVKACGDEPGAIRFFTPPEEGKQILVRWADKKRVDLFAQIGDLEIPEKGIRVIGEYEADDQAIFFDLKNTEGVGTNK